MLDKRLQVENFRDEKYLFTLKALRSKNFSKNLPFLIVSEKLPDGQVYREFPDGRIKLQQVSTSGGTFNFTILQQLQAKEADRLRKAYGLL